MNRSLRLLTAFSACAFLLASCSSGASKTKTTLTIGNSVPRSDPVTTPGVPIASAVCSLVPPATVTSLLGSSTTGQETDLYPVYKTCDWATTAAAGSTPAKLNVGVIRLGNGQAGFGTALIGFTPHVLEGVGDSATYSVGKNSEGAEKRLLVTNKGTISLSIAVTYAGSTAAPDSTQDQLTSLAKKIFSKLGA